MWGADDPCDRIPMVWPDMIYEPQQVDPAGRQRSADAVIFDESLFGFYRAAIGLRRESTALRRGDIEFIVADDPAQFIAFRRSDGDETLLIGLNRGDEVFRWKIPLNNGETVAQIFTASGEVEQVKISGASETVVTVPAVDAVVLRVSREE